MRKFVIENKIQLDPFAVVRRSEDAKKTVALCRRLARECTKRKVKS